VAAGLSQPQRAGEGSFTLAVSDIDEVMTHVQALGIDTGRTSAGPQVKTLMITDPDGNHIAFAQAIDQRLAQ
jgi:predicted enzyme related to lactoylglutathione lyase